jgi:Na+/H+ antiporter NhaD/arsenite permease-like protein
MGAGAAADTEVIVAVFATVYLGMLIGRLPRLALDRTGIALLGAIVLLATGATTLERAAAAIDAPTLMLLFGLMVVSAQLRLGGFYARTAGAIATLPASPPRLLALLVAAVGALSAVFSNDIVCLAMTPVLIEACARRGLDPVPFLLALAAAANVGSAATLIGNPQNMLIGQALGLSFAGYLAQAIVPTALGLAATWAVVAWQCRGRWTADATRLSAIAAAHGGEPIPSFDRWQAAKGLAVAAALFVAFVAWDRPREIAALAGAGVLLLSRRMHSRATLGLVDWPLLVLFIGLFVVNDAMQGTGLPEEAVAGLRAIGVDAHRPPWLFAAAALLSNAVSNVPAVMLLLPLATHPLAGPVLALASTLAGNLLIVGSIANMIVVEAAARRGVDINWRRHARTGVPVTLATLAIAAAWLALAPAPPAPADPGPSFASHAPAD